MPKKILSITICLILVSIVFFVGIKYSVNNNEKAYSEKVDFMYEGEPGVEFVCMSFNEFNDKIKTGDIRSINQDSIDDWEQKSKELYSKWYDIGFVPSIKKMEDSQLYSYKYSNNEVGISFVGDYEQINYYYDVIVIQEEIEKNKIDDIQEYYTKYNIEQNDNLIIVGGSYNELKINNKNTIAAVTNFDDGTKSIDFIWESKYWVRMWDDENKLDEILSDFNIIENLVSKPNKFDSKNFKGEVSKPQIASINIDDLNNSVSAYSLNRQVSEEQQTINDLFKNKIPSILFNQGLENNYLLESTEFIENEISYIVYKYKNSENDNIVSIAITPDIYLKSNVEMHPEIYTRKFNTTNPYRFDVEMAQNYGVYTVSSYDNVKYYTMNTANLTNGAELTFEYSNEGYEYSEYIILKDNIFIKLSYDEECQVESLKELSNYIEVVYE